MCHNKVFTGRVHELYIENPFGRFLCSIGLHLLDEGWITNDESFESWTADFYVCKGCNKEFKLIKNNDRKLKTG